MIRLSNVTYTYPFQAAPALRGISLHVRPGEAVLCTGASGCGKSTLIRVVNGLCPHSFQGTLSGSVTVAGEDNLSRQLHRISQDVGTLFQDPEQQFFALNVEDEIAFAHEWQGAAPEDVRRRIDAATREFDITHLRDASVHDLSEGQKQKVALASIMSLGPRVLILDEPTANLDPESTHALAEKIARLKTAGMAILIVDHRLYWLEGVADRVAIMQDGTIATECPFEALSEDIVSRYGLRRAKVADARDALADASTGEPFVCAEGLYFAYRNGPELYGGCSLAMPRGVTGILGDNGVGKTTLARLMTGLSAAKAGRISIGGTPCAARDVLARASIVLQNTDHQLHMKTVWAELDISAQDVPKAERRRLIEDLLRRFNITHLKDRHPQSLSGGEKQRLVIACGMASRPDILILDEPTSGLDGENMRLIADAVTAASRGGVCVMLISHDLELLGDVCDYALRLPLAAPVPTPTTTQETCHV
jgi:energy-coupling factor transport system ATP-binding protein